MIPFTIAGGIRWFGYGRISGFDNKNLCAFIYAEQIFNQGGVSFFSFKTFTFKLSLDGIKQIFNEPEDIFPSDIGEETDFSQPTFLIGNNGQIIPGAELFKITHSFL